MDNTNFPKISLKAARVNAGMSQKQAASKIGVSVATIQNCETGATVPDWETVGRIQEAYCFPADYIFFKRNYA